MHVIEVEHVTKGFRARQSVRSLLLRRGVVSNLIHGRKAERMTALEDVSLTVDPGESVGIIGANGSGKSTLLKILAGVTVPTSGHVTVRGRVASLLELGAGFHPMLTGRENVYLNAGLLGMRHAQVDAVFDEIVRFSGIEEFIDQPVDTYSSGMYVRIGFAVAAHVNPDIFLVDEVLSVGDEEFQRKCRIKIGELREQGKTIVFVSHDLSTVNTLCERVILLDKGRMIARGSPRKTIDFYLRQIGQESGVHTMTAGRIEAIFCHGRLSVFHDTNEVTGSSGFFVQLKSFESWHASSTADWEVEERGPNYCRARGRMLRLPLGLVWEMRIEAGRLLWHMTIDCEREVTLDAIEVDLLLPASFERWCYGDQSGSFPSLLPSDLAWTLVVPPDLTCREMAAIPEEGASVPPVVVSMETSNPHTTFQCQNTDYVTGCRVLQVFTKIPETNPVLSAGRHDLAKLTIDLECGVEHFLERIRDAEASRNLRKGNLTAGFRHGHIQFSCDSGERSMTAHIYTSLLIGNLWNDSVSLRWDAIQQKGDTLEVTGESRRFAFRQHWKLDIEDNGIRLHVWLEAIEPLDVQEYHTSVLLVSAYDCWETEHETGPYPDFDPANEDWQHANRNYAPGAYIKAWAPSLPTVTLESTVQEIPFRMTAINTGYQQRGRVLQALRTPDRGILHFEKGRHLCFAGTITADAPMGQHV